MAHNVAINDKLYDDLRSFCQMNGLKISTFCNDCITKALNIAKYGDTPFMDYNEPDRHQDDSIVPEVTLPYDENPSIVEEIKDDEPSDNMVEPFEELSIPAINENIAEIHPEPQNLSNKPRKRKLA